MRIRNLGFFQGLLLGSVFPVIAWIAASYQSGFQLQNGMSYLPLVALAVNILGFRFLIVKPESESAGKSVLLISLVYALLYFFKLIG